MPYIECKLRRPAGTKASPGGPGTTAYHFLPVEDGGPHIADVPNRAHLKVLLEIPGYEYYSDGGTPAFDPIEPMGVPSAGGLDQETRDALAVLSKKGLLNGSPAPAPAPAPVPNQAHMAGSTTEMNVRESSPYVVPPEPTAPVKHPSQIVHPDRRPVAPPIADADSEDSASVDKPDAPAHPSERWGNITAAELDGLSEDDLHACHEFWLKKKPHHRARRPSMIRNIVKAFPRLPPDAQG